ncbi:MAG: hypothetical protein ACRDGB_12525 [Candidatus Limnocylindria bacterium]
MAFRILPACAALSLALSAALVAPARAAEPTQEPYPGYFEEELSGEASSVSTVTLPGISDGTVSTAQACSFLFGTAAGYNEPALSLDIEEIGEAELSTDCDPADWPTLVSYVSITHSGCCLVAPFFTDADATATPPAVALAFARQVVPTYAFPNGYFGPGTVIEWFYRFTIFRVDGARFDFCVEASVVFPIGDPTFRDIPCPGA